MNKATTYFIFFNIAKKNPSPPSRGEIVLVYAREKCPFLFKNLVTTCSFSLFRIEQVIYAIIPELDTRPEMLCKMFSCVSEISFKALKDNLHFDIGSRRHVPDPEHGASTNITS